MEKVKNRWFSETWTSFSESWTSVNEREFCNFKTDFYANRSLNKI